MKGEWESLSENVISYFTIETENKEPVSFNTKNIHNILATYRASICDIVNLMVYFVDAMLIPAKRRKMGSEYNWVAIDKFFDDFVKDNFDIRSEIENFEKEEQDIYKHMLAVITSMNSTQEIKPHLNDTDALRTQIIKLKDDCYKQKLYIIQLQRDLRVKGIDISNNFRAETIDGSFTDFQTPSNSYFVPARRPPVSEVRLNINKNIELVSRQHNEIRNTDIIEDTSELMETGLFRTKKSINWRNASRSRKDFNENKKRTVSQNRRTSKSIYGELSQNEDDDDIMSLKSDVSRHKQEVTMLNKEIEILRKELIKRSKEVEIIGKAKKEREVSKSHSELMIKDLKKQLDEKDKELSDHSHLSDNSVSIERQLKALATMKKSLDNLIKDKKDLKLQMEITQVELKNLQTQFALITDKLTHKEKEYKELELINQKLSESYLIAVQRENRMAEKVERLSVKLKVYDKFFKDQKIDAKF